MGRKGRCDPLIGNHIRAERFHKRNSPVPIGLFSRDPPHHDQRRRGRFQHFKRRRDGLDSGCWIRFHGIARDIGNLRHRIEFRFLHRHIEDDIDRALRVTAHDAVRPQNRFDGRFGRAWLIVPFNIVADQGTLIPRRVYPIYPWAPQGRVDRPGRAEHHYRRPVAPSIEDRHGRVHQSHIAVYCRSHRFVRDLSVTVRDGDAMFLV